MKRNLLLGMLLGTLGLSAQETHHINWFMGVTDAAASAVVNEGDTVMWTWTDAMPHTVTSMAGGTETFDSGTLTGNGQTFSHTFTEAGETSYECIFHDMHGVITVEAVAGINDAKAVDFEFYPNPVTDILTINAKEAIDRIEIYDANGRQVMNSKSGNATSKVYMASYPAGSYFINVYTAGGSESLTVIKK